MTAYMESLRLIHQTQNEKAAAEQLLLQSQQDEQTVYGNCYQTRNNTESITQLIAVKRTIESTKIKLLYLNRHLDDLNHFLRTVQPQEIRQPA